MKTNKFFLLSFFFLWMYPFAGITAQETNEDFNTFLKHFVSSAEFQYSRIKFPLRTSLILISEDETEEEVPFTAENWLLLGAEDLKVFKEKTPHGIMFGQFVVKDKDHIEYETGLEESELDLSVTFDLIDGKWYVTDCLNSWYDNVTPVDFDGVVYEAQQRNREFIEKNP